MKFVRNSFVKVSSTFTQLDKPETPIWGGVCGYVGGEVQKAFTHAHDPIEHECEIMFFNGKKSKILAVHLEFLSDAERDFSMEYIKNEGSLVRDIFILVKTNEGRYVLNTIEHREKDVIDKNNPSRFVVGITRCAMPTMHHTDAEFLDQMASFPDYVEKKVASLYEAQREIYDQWKIPMARVFKEFPLVSYACLETSVTHAPKTGPAMAIFHLTKNICDIQTES